MEFDEEWKNTLFVMALWVVAVFNKPIWWIRDLFRGKEDETSKMDS